MSQTKEADCAWIFSLSGASASLLFLLLTISAEDSLVKDSISQPGDPGSYLSLDGAGGTRHSAVSVCVCPTKTKASKQTTKNEIKPKQKLKSTKKNQTCLAFAKCAVKGNFILFL